MKKINKKEWMKALECLDTHLDRPMKLLIVGGGALLLAHDLPLATSDIDAVPFQSDWTLSQLDQKVKEVAEKLHLSPDWLNPYFMSFSYVLPKDYDERLIPIFKGKNMNAFALGVEDLLILKCFAGRERDIEHARFLIKKCKNLTLIEKHLESLLDQRVPKAQEALDFFDEIKELIGKK